MQHTRHNVRLSSEDSNAFYATLSRKKPDEEGIGSRVGAGEGVYHFGRVDRRIRLTTWSCPSGRVLVRTQTSTCKPKNKEAHASFVKSGLEGVRVNSCFRSQDPSPLGPPEAAITGRVVSLENTHCNRTVRSNLLPFQHQTSTHRSESLRFLCTRHKKRSSQTHVNEGVLHIGDARSFLA